MTDQARVILEVSEYEPYGQLLNRPIQDGPGYTGHVSDALTGLSYMQQRYYDPMLGTRFLSVDPVAADKVGGNFNRYWYANNNPYRFSDTDGRLATQIFFRLALSFLLPNKTTSPAPTDFMDDDYHHSSDGPVGRGGRPVRTDRNGSPIFPNEVYNNSEGGERPTGDGIKFDDKIKGQMGDRGWTEEGVRDLTKTEPAGTSVDNTKGQKDTATVYGTKQGGHVIVNDRTGNVTQVSDKNDPDWKPDRRIHWEDK